MANQENYKLFLKWNSGEAFRSPFEKEKTSSNILSKYTTNSGIASINRISYSVVNLLMEVWIANNNPDKSNVAAGFAGDDFIVERYVEKDSGKKEYQVARYNENDGILCFCVDEDTNNVSLYENDESRSGLILLLSLWDKLSPDIEFFENYSKFEDFLKDDNIEEAWKCVAILSDNIYRRMKNDMIEGMDVNFQIEEYKTNEIKEKLSKGVFTPTSYLFGNFKFLKQQDESSYSLKIENDDFIGKYPINPSRIFTEEEKLIMKSNKLEDYYIIGNDDIEICNDIIETTNTNIPFRTFTLVGPPGTGKSMKVKAAANAIVLPNAIYTCNPSSEIFDFIGQIMPPSMDEMEKDAWEFASKIEELGGLNFANIAKVYGLPNVFDIIACPNEIYSDITGNKKTELGIEPTTNDAIKAWTTYMTEQFNSALRKLSISMKAGSGFKYTKTDFIRAIEKGWVVEIQEPNVILNEGVLVGLNSILNEGVITLQDGRVIKRHPDNVTFFTTNYNLNGLRNMNQSFLDRSNEIFYVENPPANVVADRVMKISGNSDRELVLEMCKLMQEVNNKMEKEGIDDGVCGIRSVINWAIKSRYVNSYDAAIKTLVNKSSLDDSNRKSIQNILDNSVFYKNKSI